MPTQTAEPGESVKERPLRAASGDASELLRRYAENRDPADLDALARRFRPMARRLALRYARGSEPIDDLEQVALLGLVKALQRFDPSRGLAFTSFAVPTILGELKRSFRDTAWAIHVPRPLQERSAVVRKAIAELETEHGRSPTIRQVAAACGMTEEEVLEGMEVHGARSAVSLDAPLSAGEDEESLSLGDSLGSDETGYERADDRSAIEAAMPALTEMQRTVLELRFGQGLKQSEIGAQLGVSQMQVSRTLAAALERLRIVAGHHSRVPVAA